mmetsp:Transcript_103184/g.296046  ORF Transcript_103184/g.296046 Transcript_103184/m.296046 type:complete len:223 (-) Transcript_103184:4116-4784(-)
MNRKMPSKPITFIIEGSAEMIDSKIRRISGMDLVSRRIRPMRNIRTIDATEPRATPPVASTIMPARVPITMMKSNLFHASRMYWVQPSARSFNTISMVKMTAKTRLQMLRVSSMSSGISMYLSAMVKVLIRMQAMMNCSKSREPSKGSKISKIGTTTGLSFFFGLSFIAHLSVSFHCCCAIVVKRPWPFSSFSVLIRSNWSQSTATTTCTMKNAPTNIQIKK